MNPLLTPALQQTWQALLTPGTPLHLSALLLLGVTVLCWVLGLLTANYSWVDRLWSVVPPLYAGIFAWADETGSGRLRLMTALSVVWGARLTFNFARKKGYDPREEDYRWEHVRAWLRAHDPLHPLGQQLFALLFIAVYQHLLLWLLVAPVAYGVWLHREVPLGPLDALAAALFLLFLALETLTDQQQWNFQQAKHALSPEARSQAGGDLARGFRTTGVFRYSRHLNFFSEFMQWWCFAAFGVAAGLAWLNWTELGALLLTLLFQGSTWLTELLSVAKYPAYRRYQQTTSRLVPWLPGPSLDGQTSSSSAPSPSE